MWSRKVFTILIWHIAKRLSSVLPGMSDSIWNVFLFMFFVSRKPGVVLWLPFSFVFHICVICFSFSFRGRKGGAVLSFPFLLIILHCLLFWEYQKLHCEYVIIIMNSCVIWFPCFIFFFFFERKTWSVVSFSSLHCLPFIFPTRKPGAESWFPFFNTCSWYK